MALQNLTIYRNDDASFDITVTQNGTVQNITGWSFRMTAKWRYSDLDAAAVFTLTVGSGITLTTPASGIATVTIGRALTSTLPPHRVDLVYDIQTNASASTGTANTIMSGTLTVLPDVSITFP